MLNKKQQEYFMKIRVKKKKLIMFGGITLVFILLLFLIMRKPNNSTLVTQQIVPTPELTQTILTFSPQVLTLSSNSLPQQNMNIVIDTRNNSIYGADLEIRYDPTIISNIQLKNGPFLPLAKNIISVSPKPGSISYILALPLKHLPVQGTGVLATMSLRVNLHTLKTAKQAYITFLGNTQVSGSGSKFSVLRIAYSGKLVYLDP